MKTQRKIGDLYELNDEAVGTVKKSAYYNDDLAPTKTRHRTWNTYNMASLWIGMSICTASYMLPASLVAVGFAWWQAILTVTLGNLIVLVPIILNAHAGTKYGIPFPVFARLAFGVRGSNIAALARAVTGAGWFGINCWLGSEALNSILSALSSSWADWSMNIGAAFLAFWALNVYITYKGPELIRFMESWGSPLLIVLCVALTVWSVSSVYQMGKGFSDIFASMPMAISEDKFWPTFLGGLMGNISFWATLALNIPDFSRYSKDQSSQIKGQLIGLVPSMFGIAIVGTVVTGATFVTTGKLLWDPVQVIANSGNPFMIFLGAVGILIATLTTNIAANAVATTNDISNFSPQNLPFKKASLITGAAGIAIMPWKLMATAGAYIFGWLDTYGMILGPLAGIFIADYYIHRKMKVDILSLYQSGKSSRYWYTNGINWKAVLVWVVSFMPALLGKMIPAISILGNIGWVLGFVLALILYPLVMKSESGSLVSDEENEIITEFADKIVLDEGNAAAVGVGEVVAPSVNKK